MSLQAFRIKKEVVETICNSFKKQISDRLYDADISKEILDANDLRKAFFNDEDDKFDIFISHSHEDKDEALKLAGYIEQLTGKKVFCDYAEWGNYKELLKKIDDQYCLRIDNNYSYEKSSVSASHIHMILASSLIQIISKAETIIFLDSKNLHPKKAKKITSSNLEERTLSPWVYLETMITDLLVERISINENIKFSRAHDSALNIAYTTEINKYTSIESISQLNKILS